MAQMSTRISKYELYVKILKAKTNVKSIQWKVQSRLLPPLVQPCITVTSQLMNKNKSQVLFKVVSIINPDGCDLFLMFRLAQTFQSINLG